MPLHLLNQPELLSPSEELETPSGELTKETEQKPTQDLMATALGYHAEPRPGKLEISITKPCATQQQLSLAYSPGVSVPVGAIVADPEAVYRYTAKGNLVAVITDGSAVLGLGNTGPLASKPVMEGKAVLFKSFAGLDAIDIEVEAESPEAFVDTVARISPTFGGINLEDIAAPHCFMIEQALIERLDIPVLHDDQHGTAITIAAALQNALELQGKSLPEARIVCVGAGAAGIATLRLLVALGLDQENILLVDRQGVIREESQAPHSYCRPFISSSPKRTLEEAIEGADVFIGVAAPNLLTMEMLKSMASRPIVFALSNPDPEIDPGLAHAARDDLILATGRTDYPNQVNNVLVFPFLFRAALNVRARCINDAMKLAAVRALVELTKEPVPKQVLEAYGEQQLAFGANYILPKPLDPRLREFVTMAITQAAIESGIARI
ncbi:Malic enzyme, NAD binding domain protein [Nitrosococcus oceani AFC27]|nr:Malic enzyme, NAD binding domain protein [Nitrosococcus oceani AFC27]GEM20530.1 malate dehydrogenase [Nitrosococcus oceani]